MSFYFVYFVRNCLATGEIDLDKSNFYFQLTMIFLFLTCFVYRAILYEEKLYSKRKINDFMSILEHYETVHKCLKNLQVK